MNEELKERFGELVDTIDNLNSALSMPLPDSIHVNAMREELPEVLAELKNIFVSITGENPWNYADIND